MIKGEGDTAGSTRAPRTGVHAASEASDGGSGTPSLVTPTGIGHYHFGRVAEATETWGQHISLLDQEMQAATRAMRELIASFPWWLRIVIRVSFFATRVHLAVGKFIGRLK